MALGWMSLLKTVPWTDVIANAPVVAEGAKKLWTAVSRKAAGPQRDATAPASQTTVPTEGADDLLPRLRALEAQAEDLRQQVRTSAELIGQLAAQNTLLVASVEAHRRRLRVLSLAAALCLAGLALAAARWALH